MKNNKEILNYIKDILPGFVISIIIALLSIKISNIIPNVGASTISILLGISLGNLFLGQNRFQSGYKFSESNLLSYSIVLLGGTLNISKLIEIGLNGILFVILQMTITIIATLYIGKKLGFSQNFRMLMASGNAVCGSSAIAATAPVINADDKDKRISITIVNITGIFLMFLLPLLSGYLYNHKTIQTSAMIGGTLQSMGQVVASGAMVNEDVKDIATIFKIVRIVMLIAVVFIFGYIKNNDKYMNDKNNIEYKKNKIKVPWYIIGFFITFILFSLNIITPKISNIFKYISHNFEIIALSAIGLKVNIKDLIKQGAVVSLYGLFVGIIQIISSVILINIFL